MSNTDNLDDILAKANAEAEEKIKEEDPEERKRRLAEEKEKLKQELLKRKQEKEVQEKPLSKIQKSPKKEHTQETPNENETKEHKQDESLLEPEAQEEKKKKKLLGFLVRKKKKEKPVEVLVETVEATEKEVEMEQAGEPVIENQFEEKIKILQELELEKKLKHDKIIAEKLEKKIKKKEEKKKKKLNKRDMKKIWEETKNETDPVHTLYLDKVESGEIIPPKEYEPRVNPLEKEKEEEKKIAEEASLITQKPQEEFKKKKKLKINKFMFNKMTIPLYICILIFLITLSKVVDYYLFNNTSNRSVTLFFSISIVSLIITFAYKVAILIYAINYKKVKVEKKEILGSMFYRHSQFIVQMCTYVPLIVCLFRISQGWWNNMIPVAFYSLAILISFVLLDEEKLLALVYIDEQEFVNESDSNSSYGDDYLDEASFILNKIEEEKKKRQQSEEAQQRYRGGF